MNNKNIPLIERITVCGLSYSNIQNYLSNPNNNYKDLNKLNIEILEDYKSKEIPNDPKYNAYYLNIPKYSLPKGVCPNKFKEKNKKEIISFSLVHDTKIKYCSSLIFYENYVENEQNFSLLNSITVVSSKEYFGTQHNILNYIYEILINYSINKFENSNLLKINLPGDRNYLEYNILEFYFSLLLNELNISSKYNKEDYQSFCIMPLINEKNNINQKIKPFLTYYIEDYSPFPIKDYDITIILDFFHIEDIIKIYQAILMEYKIIFIFKDYETINQIIYSFLSLIYPLKWRFPISAFLIPETEAMLDAPFAAILGIYIGKKNLIDFRLKKNLFPNETIIYDLTIKDFVFINEFSNGLPLKLMNKIKIGLCFLMSEKLSENISKKSYFYRLFKNCNSVCNYIDKTLFFNLKIITIFFEIFIEIIKNFKKSILVEEINKKIDIKNCQVSDFFNFDQYENNYNKTFDIKKSYISFFRNFIKTLMFSNFLRNFVLKKHKPKYSFIDYITDKKYTPKEIFDEKIREKIYSYYNVRILKIYNSLDILIFKMHF